MISKLSLQIGLGLHGMRHSFGATVAFSPEQLSGLVLWYDASDTNAITTVSGAVSQLNDKSVSGINLTQATAGLRPTIVASASPSGRQAILFNPASTQYLRNAAISLPCGEFTSFIVGTVKSTASASARLISMAKSAVADAVADGTVLHRRDSSAAFIDVMTTTSIAALAACVYDQWYVHTGTRESTAVRSKINAGTEGTNLTATAPAGTFNRISIGAQEAAGGLGTVWWAGYLGELFIYNRVLTTNEKTMCEGYAATRWGT